MLCMQNRFVGGSGVLITVAGEEDGTNFVLALRAPDRRCIDDFCAFSFGQIQSEGIEKYNPLMWLKGQK